MTTRPIVSGGNIYIYKWEATYRYHYHTDYLAPGQPTTRTGRWESRSGMEKIPLHYDTATEMLRWEIDSLAASDASAVDEDAPYHQSRLWVWAYGPTGRGEWRLAYTFQSWA
jgi:hypothetical protein